MERKFSVKGILCLAVAMASMVILPSCSDDDDNTPTPNDPKQIAGEYKGQMLFASEGVEIPDTVKIEKSVVTTDTIAFDKFPVDAIIVSILGGNEEAAAPIIAAVGDVKYRIGYKADASASTDSTFAMELDPKSLQILLPKEEEGAVPDTVLVNIAGDKGVYGIKGKALTFDLKVEKVSLNGTNLEAVKPIDLSFELKK